MKIAFQKRQGLPALSIAFFWKMEIGTQCPVTLTDHFIPELFFDYFFIKKGKIRCVDGVQEKTFTLSTQVLKTIHIRPLTFVLSAPLVLYGARLTLPFAESFWGEMKANSFSKQPWAAADTDDLDSFQCQVVEYLENHRVKKLPYPMFSSDLQESHWLVNFSARHKRRLYKTAFGLSRKEIQNIRNVHSFLEQSCDFAAEAPRIIHHMNPDVFYDQPHLNHTFRKLAGVTPVEYFQVNSILQDHLMSASYNEVSGDTGTL